MKDRNKIIFGFIMLLMVVGIIGFSYALFTTKVEKKGALNIVAGTLSCPIESKDLNEQGEITLRSKEEREIEVTLTNLSETSIHSRITYSGSNNIEVLAADNNEGEIELQSLSNGETRTYNLKLTNKGEKEETVTIYGRCGLGNKELAFNDGETEIEGNYVYTYRDRSGANRPNLAEGLIPVYYDESKSSWVKADLYKKWYDYDKQEWANAVTVVETTTSQEGHNRDYYQTAEAGTPILIEDINTMWVWIPRYEYKFTNLGTNYAGGTDADHPGEIGVNFINGTNIASSDSKNYMIHPAFTFGEDELTGLWYGKFETSNQENKYTNNDSSLTPIIKPGVTSWRNISVSNAFYAALSMKSEGKISIYGLNSEKIDTHMSKNSEWGAVAYLSQSKYGKYHVDQQEVYINNCSNYITGIAGDTADAPESTTTCTKNTYETLAGQKASTTGNITGVYDMSGGAWDRVMGVLDNGNGKPAIASSGFIDNETSKDKKIPEPKYYDLYSGTTAETACEGGVCYGQALSETAGWYNDTTIFVNSPGTWFDRGGYYIDSTSAGVFHFNDSYGDPSFRNTFRLALTTISK